MMTNLGVHALRPMLNAYGVFLLTTALLLPLVAVAQSSPDKVNITRLAYDKKKKTLTVAAVSSAQSSVRLTAQGLERLNWNASEQIYPMQAFGRNQSVFEPGPGGVVSLEPQPLLQGCKAAPRSQWVTVKALWYRPSDWLEGLRLL